MSPQVFDQSASAVPRVLRLGVILVALAWTASLSTARAEDPPFRITWDCPSLGIDETAGAPPAKVEFVLSRDLSDPSWSKLFAFMEERAELGQVSSRDCQLDLRSQLHRQLPAGDARKPYSEFLRKHRLGVMDGISPSPSGMLAGARVVPGESGPALLPSWNWKDRSAYAFTTTSVSACNLQIGPPEARDPVESEGAPLWMLSREFLESGLSLALQAERAEAMKSDQVPGCRGRLARALVARMASLANGLCDQGSTRCGEEFARGMASVIETVGRGMREVYPELADSNWDFPDSVGDRCNTRESNFLFLKRLERETWPALSCVRLGVGQAASFRLTDPAVTAMPGTSYRLSRSDENTYEAEITVRFNPVRMDGVDQLDRANACLEAIASGLRSPDGRTLKIRMIAADSKDPALEGLQARDISVYDPVACSKVQKLVRKGGVKEATGLSDEEILDHLGSRKAAAVGRALGGADLSDMVVRDCGRADSSNWQTSQSCGTTLHETLHLLGLCDEYAESLKGYRISRDGDVIRFENDLRSSTRKERRKFPESRVLYDCRVKASGTSMMASQWQKLAECGIDPMSGKAGAASMTESCPLLRNWQMNAIVSPGCESTTRKYLDCAARSYRSSFRVEYDQRGVPSKLTDTPEACGTPEERSECEELYRSR